MMSKLIKRGLIAIAPLVLTIAILVWLFRFIEDSFRGVYEYFFGAKYYFPGMGILIGLVILFIIGALLNTWLVKKITNVGESIIQRIPIFKSVYSAIRDATKLIDFSADKASQKVVKVQLGSAEFLGLVTRQDFSDFPSIGEEDQIAVFMPMSYQIGGFMGLFKKSQVQPIDLGVEEAMQFVITAGAKKGRKRKK